MKYLASLSRTIAITLLATLPLHAQDATKPSPQQAALAEKLMGLFEVEKNMSSSLNQIMAMQEKSLDSMNLSPEAKAKQKHALDVALAETKSIMSWEAIKPTFIEIYSEVFTAEEMQGMVDFFQTPMGQSWIKKQPQLQTAIMQKMQTLMMNAQPKIQAAMQKAMAEDNANPAPTAPPKAP